MADATPTVLRWARETLGLDVDTGAKRIGVKPEVLTGAETGRGRLTFSQLTKAASVYKRPLAVFFLSKPPVEKPVVADFRRLPDAEESQSPELRYELRRLARKRAIAVRLGEVERDWAFVGSLRADRSADSVGRELRKRLGVTPEAKKKWKDDYSIFGWWRTQVEALGVLVFLSRRIDTTEMRGLSIAQKPYPLIALNRADSPRARLFSLLHELTHVLLGTSSMCDLSEDEGSPTQPDHRHVEKFCNAVAAETLIPRTELVANAIVMAHMKGESRRWSDNELRLIANDFGVSNEATLRRLVTVELATKAEYAAARARWLAALRDRPDDDSNFGERGYQIVLRTQGHPYVHLVLDALHQNKITVADVADYLDVKLDHLADLETAAIGHRVPKRSEKPDADRSKRGT